MNKSKDSVKREIVINAPLAKVWDALTKPEHLNRWYTKEAKLDFRVGGKGYMNHGWGVESEGIFSEIVDRKYFVLQSPDGDFKTITSLQEVENGIKVSIEYQASFMDKLEMASKENMLFGTGQFLENLKLVYEKGIDNRKNLWRTWIGIIHASNLDGIGTKVLHVKEGSNADIAGIKAGDSITGIDGEAVDGYESFERLVNEKTVNSIVSLAILRGGNKFEVKCEAWAYPVPY
ncbi:SRPBCC domain-containing protein [Ornithinibacillus contaminans]|uniref:SRPBCC domain-containing protein n=1 Tax=Ornithinibacillus contaminans TaxID=694055 RepID=UPI00064D766F|nr:SRPBCC domain-containing protein [Ornithinibacillus contaminans]